LEFARQVADQIPLPAVAIAGIDEANVGKVLETGLRAVAVTAVVAGCDEPLEVVRRLKAKLTAERMSKNGGADILVCPSKPTEPQFTAYGRRLPHWRLDGATYSITFRVLEGELRPAERTVVLEHLRSGDPKFYTLIAAVVMPDHVHILLRPATDVDLVRIMKGTKGVTARKVNDLRGVRGLLWQDESWDRIMRDQGELDEKIEYCMNNPVKRELVTDPWDYPWWFYKPDRD
jgi:REP element-mobilizing transposase RayT